MTDGGRVVFIVFYINALRVFFSHFHGITKPLLAMTGFFARLAAGRAVSGFQRFLYSGGVPLPKHDRISLPVMAW